MKNWPVFFRSFSSSWKGMKLTLRHILRAGHRRKVQDVQSPDYFLDGKGLSTLLYPYESVPVPDHGRYMLHNEIEDCIVCDKCAKICPVDCIEIEPIRSVSEFGKTSDGTSKRIFAARFDIDMAKCCFCGLCTTVCPTECLVMTPEYDVPVLDLGKLNFGFGNLSEEEAEEKRKEWEEEKSRKEAAKTVSVPAEKKVRPSIPGAASPDASSVEPEKLNPRPRISPFPRPSKPDKASADENG
jgi:formate hydrogenlyase subunit 6/NADH:ubiquinone oxidoreductase subunit I